MSAPSIRCAINCASRCWWCAVCLSNVPKSPSAIATVDYRISDPRGADRELWCLCTVLRQKHVILAPAITAVESECKQHVWGERLQTVLTHASHIRVPPQTEQ